jgi:hypothetical protein
MMEKEKALYISSNLFPVTSGGSIYAYGNILRFSHYFDIDLVSFVQSKDVEAEPYYPELREQIQNFSGIRFDTNYLELVLNALKYKVVFQKYSKKMVEIVRNLIRKNTYQCIFLNHILVFYLLDEIRKYQNTAKIILIEENIEYQNFDEQIRYSSGIISKWKNYFLSLGVERFELQSLLCSDLVLFISEQDQSIAQKAAGRALNSAVLPPYFPYELVKTPKDLEHTSYQLLILGTMWWYPNVHGAIWFIDEVFKPLKRRDSRYRLFIVGKDPAPDLQKYASDSIVLTGSVPSVDKYIKDCDFLIVPNFTGTGLKLKVLEGIMKGIPVLARPESLAGYPADLFPEEYVPRDPESFIATIIAQNEDNQKKFHFINNARVRLMENWNIDKIIACIRA